MPPATATTPFDLVFAPMAEERFGALRLALSRNDVDPRHRDAFLMERAVVELIRDLRPEEGLGAGMDEFVVLVHLAYLFWTEGCPMIVVSEAELARLAAADRAPPTPATLPAAAYVRLPPRRVWGTPLAGEPPQPLDGFFVAGGGHALAGAAVFGFHPARAGFAVVAVDGPYPGLHGRPGGTALFAPTLPGGQAAGLLSVAGMDELLELAWRAVTWVERRP